MALLHFWCTNCTQSYVRHVQYSVLYIVQYILYVLYNPSKKVARLTFTKVMACSEFVNDFMYKDTIPAELFKSSVL